MVRFAFWMGCYCSMADHRSEVGWQEALVVGQMKESNIQQSCESQSWREDRFEMCPRCEVYMI